MKLRVSLFAFAALLGLIAVSTWATAQVSIVPAIQDLLQRPAEGYNAWFWATLLDAYFGFLWFWLWIAYKETGWGARLGWLLAVLLTGNMAMAIYTLIQLYRLPPDASFEDLLLRRRAG
jgi:hypothetical protein